MEYINLTFVKENLKEGDMIPIVDEPFDPTSNRTHKAIVVYHKKLFPSGVFVSMSYSQLHEKDRKHAAIVCYFWEYLKRLGHEIISFEVDGGCYINFPVGKDKGVLTGDSIDYKYIDYGVGKEVSDYLGLDFDMKRHPKHKSWVYRVLRKYKNRVTINRKECKRLENYIWPS